MLLTMGFIFSKQNLKNELKDKTEEISNLRKELDGYKAKQAQDRYPWRNFETNGGWNHQYLQRLQGSIQKRNKHKYIKQPRILLLGLPGAGKSSFINSIASIDREDMLPLVRAGLSPRGYVTTTLRQTFLNSSLDLIIMDSMGLSEENGCHSENIKYIVGGNIQPNYKFVPGKPISENDPFFVKEPPLNEKVHCVVTVVDANVIDTSSASEDILRALRDLGTYLHDNNVPNVFVLTKIDKTDSAVGADITKVYNSGHIGKIVNDTETTFGIQKMDIFPVKNYTDESGLDDNKSILILLALRRILSLAEAFIIQTETDQNKHSAKN